MLNRRYESSSTVSGAFDRQPDQVARLVGDEILYFCEDGGADCGVHGRDGAGRFFSILDGPAYDTETTGLAFSPDKRHMYVRRADPPQTGRNDAAATTWLFRGDGVAATPRLRRGRGYAAATTWTLGRESDSRRARASGTSPSRPRASSSTSPATTGSRSTAACSTSSITTTSPNATKVPPARPPLPHPR